VRIGLGPISLARATRAELHALADAAVAASFDAIWVAESRQDGVGGGLAAAALLAQVAPIRVGAVLDFGAYHPLYMAEDIAVADITSRGRIEVLLRGGSKEQLRLLTRALSGAGVLSAGLPENQPSPARLAVNPRPAQPVVPIWVQDLDVAVARDLGVGVAGSVVAAGRWPGMLLCPNDVTADALLAAAGEAPAYILVEANTKTEAVSAGRRLVAPLRMPELPEWVTQQ
jgi:alkanesulfonate monooxygenase SsuD/methylene tetrahydromethanopterin reductase-like flavin-dependent oxidoreductase (luciferase family)